MRLDSLLTMVTPDGVGGHDLALTRAAMNAFIKFPGVLHKLPLRCSLEELKRCRFSPFDRFSRLKFKLLESLAIIMSSFSNDIMQSDSIASQFRSVLTKTSSLSSGAASKEDKGLKTVLDVVLSSSAFTKSVEFEKLLFVSAIQSKYTVGKESKTR